MARVKLSLPKTFPFSTDLRVRVTDVNYGGHLGNDRILSLIHDARVQFLNSMGVSELDVGGGLGTIMVDAVLVYKSEAFQGDLLQINVAVDDIQKFGCDIYYQLTKKATNREVARAKTGLAFFDYERRKLSPIPKSFLQKCEALKGSGSSN